MLTSRAKIMFANDENERNKFLNDRKIKLNSNILPKFLRKKINPAPVLWFRLRIVVSVPGIKTHFHR